MRKPIRMALLAAVLLSVSGCAARPGAAGDGDGTIVMDHLVFETEAREIPVGGTITFSNVSSRALHVLVIGKDAQPAPVPGAPSFGGTSGHRAEVGDRWTTPPWTTPGRYWVTCTLHPAMNLRVTVQG